VYCMMLRGRAMVGGGLSCDMKVMRVVRGGRGLIFRFEFRLGSNVSEMRRGEMEISSVG
jgi:hypothetical protein